MSKIVWVGSRQSDMKYAKGFISHSITLYGNNSRQNYALCKISNRRIGNNAQSVVRDEFIFKYIQKVISRDENTKFMFYDPLWVLEIPKLQQYIPNIICLNNTELLEIMRNKISFKELIMRQRQFNMVNSYVYNSTSLSIETISELFKNLGEPLVFQKDVSCGGSGTTLVKKTTLSGSSSS